jgi:hypothetical protein
MLAGIKQRSGHMRVQFFQLGVVMIAGLLIAGCATESPRGEPAAPDIPEPPASAVGTASAQTFHFKSRGPFAQVSFFTETAGGVVFGFLDVNRGTTNTGEQTLLFYAVERCDLGTGDCTLLEQGSGLIPNSAFVVRARESTLRINSAALPGFERFIGPGGPITLRWTQNSAVVTDFKGHTRTRIARVLMERSQFSSSSSSAFVQGTLLGTALSPDNSTGIMGRTRSGLLVVQKSP